MNNNDIKQKRGVYYAIAVIALGCLITSIYTNSSFNPNHGFSVDLSKMETPDKSVTEGTKNTTDSADSSSQALKKAGVAEKLAETNGTNVVTPALEKENKEPQNAEQLDEQNNEALKETVSNMQAEVSEETAAIETMSDAKKELSFAPEDGMGWPIVGNVILGYSMDKSIFFDTLQQYRYNPAIYIGAEQGEVVNACAKGIVSEIGTDPQIGTYVKMDVGSGYEVIYGQLCDLQVKENDLVARGQVIGNVAKATVYFTKEGDHVYLEILKDGKPVDPLTLLR